MAEIKYSIKFYSDWHCGSGLSAGGDVDALVIKDKDGLPFVPGRTIKGLIKEAVEELFFIENKWDEKRCLFIKVFGNSGDRDFTEENKKEGSDSDDDSSKQIKGNAYFSNAGLSLSTRKSILNNGIYKDFLYRQISFTAIDNDGVADSGSLRQIEVTVPCTLCGVIHDVPNDMVKEIEEGMKFIKRIGMNRNRGLGRCDIKFVEVQK